MMAFERSLIRFIGHPEPLVGLPNPESNLAPVGLPFWESNLRCDDVFTPGGPSKNAVSMLVVFRFSKINMAEIGAISVSFCRDF